MKFLALALKNLTRNKLRSLLTILGVAAGMFLFASVETMQTSLARATKTGADDTTLVVYRENRFCPSTSRLPEHYGNTIGRIDGVREVIPIQIAVNTWYHDPTEEVTTEYKIWHHNFGEHFMGNSLESAIKKFEHFMMNLAADTGEDQDPDDALESDLT